MILLTTSKTFAKLYWIILFLFVIIVFAASFRPYAIFLYLLAYFHFYVLFLAFLPMLSYAFNVLKTIQEKQKVVRWFSRRLAYN